jgi:hypothetical protein
VEHVAHVTVDEDAVVDVCLAELEVGVSLQGPQIVRGAGDEVVERNHPAAARQQGFAEV